MNKLLSNRKTPILIGFFWVTILAVNSLFLWVPAISAAPAQCYVKTGTNVVSYRSEPCDGSLMSTNFQLSGISPQDDKCYMVGDGWGIASSSNQGVEPCTQWSGQAAQIASEPPVCKLYQGSMDEYNSYNANASQLQDVGCDELKQLLENSGNVTQIDKTGLCYVGLKNPYQEGEWGVMFDTCWGILAHFVAADQAKQQALNSSINDPDREKNINCPSGTPPDQCPAVIVQNNSLVALMKKIIQFMTIIVGVVVTAVIVWAGIEYSSAGGDPNRTASAKSRIRNAIIALIVYIFLGALLQWLVPGGIFSV